MLPCWEPFLKAEFSDPTPLGFMSIFSMCCLMVWGLWSPWDIMGESVLLFCFQIFAKVLKDCASLSSSWREGPPEGAADQLLLWLMLRFAWLPLMFI